LAQKGIPQIEVTFDIDANGILSVKAEDKSTGAKQSIIIQGASNLNQEEIDEMIRNSEQSAEEDYKKRQTIEFKNYADTVCYKAEDFLKNLSSKNSIEDILPNETSKVVEIRELIEKIRLEMKSDNIEELKLIVDRLDLLISNEKK
jgi:molecular chaperone DnaK